MAPPPPGLPVPGIGKTLESLNDMDMMSMSPTTPGGNGAQQSAYSSLQSPHGIKRRASSDDELEHGDDHDQDHDRRSQSRRTTSVKRGTYAPA